MKRPKLGGHVSAAGGIKNSVENARGIGAECFQIFGASPRQWTAKIPSEESIKEYKLALKDSGLGPVYLHAAYLPNPASSDSGARKKSVENLAAHLKISEKIGAEGLVFHTGSGSLKNTIKSAKEVLKMVPGRSKLIIENSAGGGDKVGLTIDELAEIFKGIGSGRVKICLDTAHAYAAGVLEYETEKIKKFFDEWDKKIGMSELELIHANDSKGKFASNLDRHDNIGEGEIGMAGFKNLAREKRLRGVPWILETPGFKNTGPDKKNIKLLEPLFL